MPPRTPHQSIINQAQQAQRAATGNFVSASMGGQPIPRPHQPFQPVSIGTCYEKLELIVARSNEN